MDIAKLDKNFSQSKGDIKKIDKVFVLPCKEIDLYGTNFDKNLGCFQRMNANVAKQIGYNIEVLSSTTAGVRARFKTNSKNLTISVNYRYLAKMSQMPLSGSSGFILLEEDDKGNKFIAGFKPLYTDENGFTANTFLSNSEQLKDYILYFPLYNDYIEEVKLAFDENSIVTNGKKYDYDLPILYYGSSITQGGCCSRPDNCYSAYISKWHNVDYINLGFSGGAKGEDLMIDYLSTIKSLIFVCDYDHNAPNIEHLRATHYKTYESYRKFNPTTPIIFMTKPDCDNNISDAINRKKVIKNTYLKAMALGDENVYFIDGTKFFGKKDRENCTVDGCHPNDLGFYRIARKLDETICVILHKLDRQ